MSSESTADRLKALKVTDLRQILSNASVSATARSNKADLIAKVLASQAALDAFHKLHPAAVQDDLLAPPEEFTWNEDKPLSPPPKYAPVPSAPAAKPPSPVKPKSTTTQSPPATNSVSPPAATVPAAATATSATTSDDATTSEDNAVSESATAAVDPELEKRRARAERFGIPLVENPVPVNKKKGGNKPKPPQRQQSQRGVGKNQASKPAAPELSAEEQERLKARADRFGITPEDRGKKRPAKEPVDPEEEERRKKRAERFGVPVKG